MKNDHSVEPHTTTEAANEFKALQAVVSALQPLEPEARRRILDSAATFLKIDVAPAGVPSTVRRATVDTPPRSFAPAFSDDTAMSPKQFIFEKQPRTDVERLACLAFYLTHYRDTPHFKTLDLSKLNTEAAQPKFSNAANATNNAVKTGYLVQATKGQRQLSAAGEQFVRALPERDAARLAMVGTRPRRRKKRPQLAGNSRED